MNRRHIVMHAQRRSLSAITRLQIFPGPARTEAFRIEEAFIGNKVPRDSANTRLKDRLRKLRQRLAKIPMELRRERGIATSIHDQITFDPAIGGGFLRTVG